MYLDHPPVRNCPARQVIVVEESDKPYTVLFVDQVIEKARMSNATSRDADKDEIFWIVFANEPRRLWDMTESALRSSLRRPKSERLPKVQLIAMGDDAPIGEVLETFDLGNLGSFARKELPAVCRELEVTTIGDLANHTYSEISDSGRSTGNKTLEWIASVFQDFGLELRTSAV